ncbi:hypothetical protein [Candidatus Formimonas warabiya]|uniref:Uncharacterized protein n=1 Tax=Formimonas warabiya TaxID=1761012 RepID=A0A3G1KQN3_FORW1|nr:hypothetical protein [Candidatus Formimonas warabiya]ATW24782.1 hypothetical protein DCMF_08355 [Candidatus Formimonas warabiya]
MIKRRKLTKMEVYVLGAVLLAVCFYVYLSFIYDPAKKDLAQLRQQITVTRGEIAQLGAPPDPGPVEARVKKAAGDLGLLESELSYLQETKKANQQPTVTKAMALLNELAVKNELSVKKLEFMERVLEAGGAAAEDTKKTTSKTSKKKTEPVATTSNYFPWDKYSLVLTGSQAGIVQFMKDLSEAFWLVQINQLQVSAAQADKKKQADGSASAEPNKDEFEMALEISL